MMELPEGVPREDSPERIKRSEDVAICQQTYNIVQQNEMDQVYQAKSLAWAIIRSIIACSSS